MTPAALDWRSLQSKLRQISELLSDLQAIGPVDLDRMRADRTARLAVERVLTLVVDLAVSINSHVAAVESGRAPDSYSASFPLAAEVGLIDKDLAEQLRPSTGLRNVLVHNYIDTDESVVVQAVSMAIDQYGRYVEQAARWLLEHQSDNDRESGP